ncbi:MAG: two-component system, OmpR family, sensor kinase [Solirubrobacterales bacterium]|jgi:signal transduction histidine kinase|nr:two-component system, OmpR family, sensor kinase [Solirubrobacterales bacterium]
MTDLAQIVAGWPIVLSMAVAVAAQSLRAGRRRLALNEALHELRRPLQAVALAAGPKAGGSGSGRDSIELAAAALERLDREINGGPLTPVWGSVDGAALIHSAVARWQARVRLSDGSLEMRWNAGRALLQGDRHALGQALDNLIVNAIEHGGPTIVVSGRLREGRLRIAVVDSGRAARPRSRRNSHAVIACLSGQQRHGHGLGVVRRVAADHGGRFALRHSERGSLAVLELPLAEAKTGLVA